MTARAMWKAEVEIDDVRVPVKLYAAVADAKVHFRLLHEKDHTPVKQQMVDPETDEPVAPELVQRGIEVDRGVYVLLKPEEQAALEPKPSRSIAVERVVSADRIDERWFDRPYYLGPDGDDDGYFAIVDRLKELIKYKGFQVPPAELEAILITHPAVADCAVIGVPDEEAGELPKAFVVCSSEVEDDEILEFVAAKVSPQKKIRLLERIEAIPKSASGKILRRQLK